MAAMGAPRKAVIFTESRRTQDHLVRPGPAATGIYQRWLARHSGTDRVTGSPAIDQIEARRDALISALEKRLHQASRTQALFTIRRVTA